MHSARLATFTTAQVTTKVMTTSRLLLPPLLPPHLLPPRPQLQLKKRYRTPETCSAICRTRSTGAFAQGLSMRRRPVTIPSAQRTITFLFPRRWHANRTRTTTSRTARPARARGSQLTERSDKRQLARRQTARSARHSGRLAASPPPENGLPPPSCAQPSPGPAVSLASAHPFGPPGSGKNLLPPQVRREAKHAPHSALPSPPPTRQGQTGGQIDRGRQGDLDRELWTAHTMACL